MTSNNNPLLTTLSKTNNVISTTLHTTITSHTTSKKYNAKKDSLDYLSVKNGIMISYLIDLTLLLRYRLESKQSSGSGGGNNSISEERKKEIQQLQTRLLEQRTLLTKIRPLEKKLRYQIDKLLALSTLGAGTFAARDVDSEDVERKGGDKSGGGKSIEGAVGDESADPLSFKPDLQGMMKMFENVDGDEQNDNDAKSDNSDDGSEVSEDEETSSYKPKIALEKEEEDDTNTEGIYQPPRHQAVPFELDNERALLKAERLLQKQRDHLSRSELTQVIKSQFTDAPEEEDVRGGALLGKQSEASRKLAQQDAAQQELEESHMIRFTVGKKEKKLRTKMRRDELSNLNVISGGFGTVGAGVDDAFGGDNDSDGDDMLSGVKRKKSRKSSSDRYTPQNDGEGSYKMKGMRKRKVEVLNDGGSSSNRGSSKKKKGATNTYQKSLYGGSGGGGGSKSSKRR